MATFVPTDVNGGSVEENGAGANAVVRIEVLYFSEAEGQVDGVENMRFLVTAGNTREKIDDVRDWGNIFTGNTGYRIARALARVGEVDLLTSNRTHLSEIVSSPADSKDKIHGFSFTSHSQLRSLIEQRLRVTHYDAVFMSAAVADYQPLRVYAVLSRSIQPGGGQETWQVQDVQAGKVKSSHPQIAVLGQQTEKIVDLFRASWSFRGLLVKFKLEVGLTREQLVEVGQSSRRASGADYLVANTLDMVDGPGAGAFLLSDAGAEWVARDALPERMVQLVKATRPGT